jgi:hypothetical protein
LRRNCLLTRVIEEKIESRKKRGRRHKQLPDDPDEKELEFERGSSTAHSRENSLLKGL